MWGKNSNTLRAVQCSDPGRSIPSYCKCGAAFPWAGKQLEQRPSQAISPSNIIIGSPGANINAGNGSIHQEMTWVNRINQEIDKASAGEEEKKKAKSLLERISENKLLNTVVGAALGSIV